MVRLALFTLLAVIVSISAAPTNILRDDTADVTRTDTKFLRDDSSDATRTDTKFLRDDARVDTAFLKRGDDSIRADTAFLKRDGVSDRSDTKFLKRDDGISGAVWHKRGVQMDSLHSARDSDERTDTAFL